MPTVYELICPKCGAEFKDTGKEFPNGVLCPACPKGGLIGVIHRELRKATYEELEEKITNLESEIKSLKELLNAQTLRS